MRSHTSILTSTLALGLLAACGGDDTTTNNTTTSQRPIQCRSADYVAFDDANYVNQHLRVQAYVDMVAAMDAAVSAEPFDPGLASSKFAEAKTLYETTASLREKVMTRTDDHFEDKPVVGEQIDAAIMSALAAGAAATTTREAAVARQTVDKQLVHFFYLSVVHEMMLGERSKWDEAFGYAGVAVDNAEDSRKAFLAAATERDATNNTTLADGIFNGLVDGACALTEALDAANAESIDYTTVPALKAAVEDIDAQMQLVLAFSAGHEAFEMIEAQEEIAASPSDEARLEMQTALHELDPFFAPLERLMNEAGGASSTRAEDIRASIDAAMDSATDDWMQTFDAQSIVDALEAEFGIDIKG